MNRFLLLMLICSLPGCVYISASVGGDSDKGTCRKQIELVANEIQTVAEAECSMRIAEAVSIMSSTPKSPVSESK
jgi:hypothetical protein